MAGLTANVTDDEFTVVGVVVDKEPDASTKYTNHCVSLPPGVQLKLTESDVTVPTVNPVGSVQEGVSLTIKSSNNISL